MNALTDNLTPTVLAVDDTLDLTLMAALLRNENVLTFTKKNALGLVSSFASRNCSSCFIFIF